MKKAPILLALLALTLVVACRPTSKPTPSPTTTTAPSTETTSATTTATSATPELTAAPAATTVSATVSTATPPPAPLLGPGQTTATATTSTPENATVSPTVVPPTPLPPRIGTLRILAPEGQISDTVKQLLATKSGLDLQIDTYATNDEAAQKLTAAAPAQAYALALVSYRIVPHLISAQALAAVPALPLARQPSAKYLHHFFDRDNKYSLPYGFSVAGIAVRTTDVKVPPSQWSQLFNEAMLKNARLPGDNALESSLLAKANLRNSSLTGAANTADTVAPIQVDSIANLKKQFATQPGWRFVLPGEGSVIYLHCAVIPANTPAADKSASLLGVLFDPEILSHIGEENYLGITQIAAVKSLPPTITGDALIYPPERILDKCVFVRSGFRPIPAPAKAE